MGANSFLYEFAPNEMGGENDRAASPEAVLIYLKHGVWIYIFIFPPPYLQRGTTFVTSCLLSWTPYLSNI